MFDNFRIFGLEREGVRLHARVGGSGPALLLLHGHPQTQAMWHRVVAPLAQKFTVVLMDLRGYGDSGRPPAGDPAGDAEPYSKRNMALDAMAVMQAAGFAQFDVLAHDRGARVAHRLAADHPQAVGRMMLLDIAPTLAMFEATTLEFASAYWHWFFLSQPSDLAATMIDANPLAYLRTAMGSRYAGLAAFAPEAMAHYERCMQIAGTGMSICGDYRASRTIDLAHDRADVAAGLRITQPLHVLWGDQGIVGKCFDPLTLWRERALHVTGHGVPCGHYIAEERPDLVLAQALAFFDKK